MVKIGSAVPEKRSKITDARATEMIEKNTLAFSSDELKCVKFKTDVELYIVIIIFIINAHASTSCLLAYKG